MKMTDRHRVRERGTQIAEFALVLPILVFLAMLVTEGSSFVRVHQVINNAAREGARLSSLPENAPGTADHTADIVSAIRSYACNNGVNLKTSGSSTCPTTAQVQCTSTITLNQAVPITVNGLAAQASSVTVTCSYQLSYLPNLPFFGITNPVPLTGTAQFQNLYYVNPS